VPEISRFYGIVITMNRNDHPPPHFHARCGSDEIAVRIADGKIIGSFPKRKLPLVRHWLKLRRVELLQNWELLQQSKSPRYIEPLD
jgi:hypothetical protein